MSDSVITPEDAYQHLFIVKDVLLREGPAETAVYFSKVMDRWSAGRMSLDEAAYVNPGKHEKRVTWVKALERRNDAIRYAGSFIPSEDPKQIAGTLAKEITKFYPKWSGRYKDLSVPDGGWDDLIIAIFWAHFFGSRSMMPPRTYQGLKPIIEQLTES